MKERRRYQRHVVWFPVQVDTATATQRVAACSNASVSGVQLWTPLPLAIGERVTLTFRVMQSQREWLRLEGEVVHVEHEGDADAGSGDGNPSPWPNWVGVRFDEPVLKLELMFHLAEEKRRFRLGTSTARQARPAAAAANVTTVRRRYG